MVSFMVKSTASVAAALLPDQAQIPFLDEVVRILKPGGVVLITQLEELPKTATGEQHLIIDLLLKTTPLPRIPRCSMTEKEFHEIIDTLNLENRNYENYNGLLAATGRKPIIE